jgi:RNA-directed DNA polymerase
LPSRRVWIPKPDGRQRPLGIASLEDKIVQQAVLWVLQSIYEQDFLGFSYGFRPGRSQHDALDALSVAMTSKKVNWILDADVAGFLDNLDWNLALKALRHHTDNPWILLYVERWLKAPVQRADGSPEERTKGSPQGAVISPLLSNLFMHYAFDEWLRRNFPHIQFARYKLVAE